MANQDIPVSGLQNTNSISTEDLALVTVVDELSATGYTSKHITEGNRARQYLGSFTWQDLETEAKDIFGAINEAATTGGNNVFYIHWTSPSTITESGADIAAAYADGSDLVILYTDSQTGQVYTLPLVKVDDNAGALNLSFGATIYQKAQMVAYLQLLKPSYTIQGKDCTTIRVPVIKDTTTTSTTETWSAKKINDTIAAKTEINDTTTSTTTTWSSDKIADELADKAEIADTVVSTASAWSSSRIVGLLPTDTAQGAIATFTDGADGVSIVDSVFEVVAQQEGSGDPSPSNPRPITGFTGCNIVKAGKNLCKAYDFTAGIYIYSSNGKIKINGTVSDTSYTPTASQAKSNNLCFALKPGTYIPSVVGTLPTGAFINIVSENNVSLSQGAAFTLTEETEVFYRIVVPAGTYDFETYAQIEVGSTATTYEPYNSSVINVDWTTEAGTVYGGGLNLTTGVLEGTHKHITITGGSWAWYEQAKQGYILDILGDDIGSMGTTPVCNKLVGILIGDRMSHIGNFVALVSSGKGIGVSIPNCETQEDVNTWFANNSIDIAYELATPITYQLTPHELNTLLGTNNIWCDTGDSSVTYHADVQKYIDKKIAAALSNRGLNLSKSAEPEEKEPEEVKEEVKEEQEGANNER